VATLVVVPNGLALQTVELVSTLRPAAQNGAPSSADYYSGEQEKLIDLTTLESFINDTLLPILNGLPATAVDGVEGTSLYFDTTSQDVLSYNSLTNNYLAVSDTLRLLYGMIQNLQIAEADDALNITSLQQRLSSSNQNDISLALQYMTQQIQNQAGEINNLQQTVSALQLVAGAATGSAVAETPVIDPGGIETVPVLWAVPFTNNSYVVSAGIQDDSGYLRVNGFSYLASGTGVLVRVQNTDTTATHQGVVNVIGLT
jgi:hypothetical protein